MPPTLPSAPFFLQLLGLEVSAPAAVLPRKMTSLGSVVLHGQLLQLASGLNSNFAAYIARLSLGQTRGVLGAQVKRMGALEAGQAALSTRLAMTADHQNVLADCIEENAARVAQTEERVVQLEALAELGLGEFRQGLKALRNAYASMEAKLLAKLEQLQVRGGC
mgnify:CR=1 FL=1